jgi:mRNA interferase YafQ
MFTPAYTRQFQRDLKRLRRGGRDLMALKAVLTSLMAGERLAPRFKDHHLIGAWQGRRECHIRPDWLLIYKVDREQSLIIFERTGSHADLFG